MAGKKCFVISPIGSSESAIRAHADNVFKHIIEPALKKLGYTEIQRSDHSPDPTMISSKILKHVFEDDLVVTILSGNNPNVYYELAVRHSIMKPCILLIDINSEPSFDVSGMHMIRYDLSNWNSPNECVDELREAVKSAEKGKNIVNPISTALALQKSIINEDSTSKNANLLLAEQIQNLQSEVRQLSNSLKKPSYLMHSYGNDVKFNSLPTTKINQIDPFSYFSPDDGINSISVADWNGTIPKQKRS